MGRKTSTLRLREIASMAEVSVATVSRVLNGNRTVDASIRKHVLEAASKLNIDLSQSSRANALAFVLSNRAMLHAFHSRVLAGAEAQCTARGWDMIFLSFHYSPQVHWKELYLPRVLRRHDLVGAVILAGTNSPNLLELLTHANINFVVLGNNVVGNAQELKNDVVFSDDILGGQEMTRYLIGLGHRHICFVGNLRLPWFARCFEGYRRAIDEFGLRARHSTIDSEDEVEVGYLGTKSLLAQTEPLTAVFAGNDFTAQGVYKALRDSGLRVPEDVSVVGCDDTLGSCLHPPLTTIREFPEQLGKQMVELALHRIAAPTREPAHITVATEFIRRDSCKPIGSLGTASSDVLQRTTAE